VEVLRKLATRLCPVSAVCSNFPDQGWLRSTKVRSWPFAAQIDGRPHVGNWGLTRLVMLSESFVESDPKRSSTRSTLAWAPAQNDLILGVSAGAGPRLIDQDKYFRLNLTRP